MNHKIRKLTWQEFHSAVETIASYIESTDMQIVNIYGVPRGGLMLAICLSHRLNKPMVWTKQKITPYTLVVDDICDQGMTINRLLRSKPNYRQYKVMVWILNRDIIPDLMPIFWVGEKQNKEWIQFPWEVDPTPKYDGTI